MNCVLVSPKIINLTFVPFFLPLFCIGPYTNETKLNNFDIVYENDLPHPSLFKCMVSLFLGDSVKTESMFKYSDRRNNTYFAVITVGFVWKYKSLLFLDNRLVSLMLSNF
jgi:hypothetical protein